MISDRGFATGRAAVLAGLALLAVVVLHKAWVTDDAYITFRTVENFVEGRGLTWNPAERVQVYTHPLWMLLMSGVHAVSRELFYSAIAANVILTLAAAALLAFRVASSWQAASLGLALLVVSRAFTDFSTSGLENALLHFLLVLLIALDREHPAPSRGLAFAIVAGACLLTRLDAVFLVLPAWVLVTRRAGARRALPALAAGLAPLVLWEAFALLYYGSLFPNAARAKLGTGIPVSDLVLQGLSYLRNSLSWDPVTLVSLAAGCGVALAARQRTSADEPAPAPRHASAFAIGAILSLAYVVRVGGDFMSGRFLTAPFLVAVCLLVSRPLPPRRTLLAAAALLVQLAVPWTTPFRERDYGPEWHSAIDSHGIADERSFYLASGSLTASWGRRERWPDPQAWSEARWLHGHWPSDVLAEDLWQTGVVGAADRWPPAATHDEVGRPYDKVFVRGAVGFLAFHLGPEAHVLDYHAICDPLLSRLPATVPDPVLARFIPRLAPLGWRVGHYLRVPPPGYVRTLATGRNQIADPRLARYYEVIRSITRDGLLDRKRLATLWRFQLGAYDDLLREAREARPAGS